MTRRELRKTLWLVRILHRDYPQDGLWDAWRTARMIRKQTLAIVDSRPLTDLEMFELEVEMDLASLPVFVTAVG